MKKFFIFRREEINESSTKASDTGVGLSVLAVPVDQVSFITAYRGSVNITFNDAGLYDDVSLFIGDSMEKTNVTISCNEGAELILLESIVGFINGNTAKVSMKFDSVEGTGSFSSSNILEAKDVESQVKVNPTTISSGKISDGDATTAFNNTIASINFSENQPTIDYNHEGLSIFADEAEITSWANAGSGGSTYDIASNVGAPTAETGPPTSGLAKTSASLALADYFIVPNAFKVKNDYTIYLVIDDGSDGTYGPIFGDSAGETVGFCGNFYESSAAPPKNKRVDSTFSMRHDGLASQVASVSTKDSTLDWTTPFVFPDQDSTSTTYQTCNVFIIRRDENFNLFLHNRDGNIIGFIPSKTRANTPHSTSATSFLTDGDLLIEHLGTTGGVTTSGFKGHMARFGVIDYDIGVNSSVNLAQDLFNLYNP